MSVTTPQVDRFVATNLRAVLLEQGRKARWLAQQVGVSESLISKLLAGKATIGRPVAERVAGVVGVPFFVLFELHHRSENAPTGEHAQGPSQ